MPLSLSIFISLKVLKESIETYLSKINKDYYENRENQKLATDFLKIEPEKFEKILAYSKDKYNFSFYSNVIQSLILILFLCLGGVAKTENLVFEAIGTNNQSLISGLVFFFFLSIFSFILQLPFEFYYTFKIEEKHGFNRQSKKSFFTDKIKESILGLILGGLFLSLILFVMAKTPNWWLWAWISLTCFSILTSWIYPSILAPLFNKFTPVSEGELKEEINSLAQKINFKTDGIFIMDASKRSSHGNAFFTGLFGKKRIILFDTLITSLNTKEIVAVLAHELGHFKLNHVRMSLIKSVLLTGFMFFTLNQLCELEALYETFGFANKSAYGALFSFSLWMSLVGFILTPLGSFFSRKNEFQADDFAKQQLGPQYKDLMSALVKLQETNSAMPISHPVFSAFYYSHPPIVERLKALEGV